MSRGTRTAQLVAAAFVAIVYLAMLAALPRHVFWSPDEGVRYLQMRAVGWSGGLAYSLPYPEDRLERRFGERSSRCEESGFYPRSSDDGGMRSHWSMWFPLLSHPFFATLGIDGIYLVPLLCGFLTAVVAGRLAARFDRRAGAAAIILVGLGTPVFFYALCFWEHTLATLCGMIAVAVLVTAAPGSSRTLLLVAPLLAVATMLRIEMLALAVACLAAWTASRIAAARRPAVENAPTVERRAVSWRFALFTLAAFALVLLLVPGALPARHLRALVELPALLALAIRELPFLAEALVSVFVNGPTADGPALDRAWEAIAFLAAGSCLIAPLYASRRIEALLLFPSMAVLLAFSVNVLATGQHVRALHGVIPLAPYVVVAGYACQTAWRRRDYRLWALAVVALSYMPLAFLMVFVRGPLPLTGLEWGPRYFLTLYPMTALLAVLVLWESRPGGPATWLAFRALLIAMMLLAVAHEARGLATLHRRRTEIAAWGDALGAAGPIVTDVWWLPAALAPIFVSREMYCVPGRGDWSARLTATAGATLTLASVAPIEIEKIPHLAARASLQASETVAGMHIVRLRTAAPPGEARTARESDS